MRMFLRMKCENFVLAAEIPCESKFATKFASDCECDGVVHSGSHHKESSILATGSMLCCVLYLVDVSDIFYFFGSGEGKGGPRRQEGAWVGSFIENIRRWARGLEGVCGRLGGGGGGFFVYIFFWGRNSHQVYLPHQVCRRIAPFGLKSRLNSMKIG